MTADARTLSPVEVSRARLVEAMSDRLGLPVHDAIRRLARTPAEPFSDRELRVIDPPNGPGGPRRVLISPALAARAHLVETLNDRLGLPTEPAIRKMARARSASNDPAMRGIRLRRSATETGIDRPRSA